MELLLAALTSMIDGVTSLLFFLKISKLLYLFSRGDYITNEVTCDYNAGWQGLLAGLIQVFFK